VSTENPTPAKKISDVEVRNYMRVKRARLTLDGNTFVISGQNEAGKSSFVQAIEDAFGGSKFAPAMPIRKGASEAVILITVTDGSGRVLKAEVVHNAKTGRRLTVKDADGKAQSSPQSIMDAFWAETSFDPSLFLISKPADQKAMLMRLAKLDFAKLDAEYATKFSERTNVNRDVDRLKAAASMKPTYPDAPKAEASAAEINTEISQAHAVNRRHDEAEQKLQLTASTVSDATRTLTRTREEIADLERRLEAMRKRAGEEEAEYMAKHKAHGEAIAALALAQKVDIAPLQGKLAAVEETNRKVRANADKAAAEKAARDRQAEADKITARLEAITEEKAEAIRTAKFPIEGMSVDADEVTIKGIPLSQESDMRRLAIGVEMAAEMNPGKPLILVRHGNLFTPENFIILEEIATRRNLTCIVEIPGKNVAGAKLVFEDGIGVEPTAEAAP